jgi:hypothetical protein
MKEYGLQVWGNKWWFRSCIFRNHFVLVYSYIAIVGQKCKYITVELTAVRAKHGNSIAARLETGLNNDFGNRGRIILTVIT